MYTDKELLTQLEQAGIQKADTLLVHSSMKSIGEVDGGADTVLDVLCDSVSEGLLIMPTHTWATMNSEHLVFDLQEEPSCVGLLTNLFRKRPHVLRSVHPTHSVAVFGKRAAEYISQEEKSHTPCPRNGCWGHLYDEHAKILLLGVRFNRNTFIHSVEEWCDIPERLAEKPLPFQTKPPNETIINTPSCPHYNKECPDISANFVKIEQLALQEHAAEKIQFGDASCFLCDARTLAELVEWCLARNPDLFVNDAPIPDSWYTEVQNH